jgi:Ohr subfamily peroxiredoxin
MKLLYTARVKTTGGREGRSESDDGNLKVSLTMPKSLGGAEKSGTTNPEQLFAAGYSACFESAIRHVARAKKVALGGLTVEAEVGLRAEGQGFALEVTLHPVFEGLDEAVRAELVAAAHQVCPYSNAVKGNIDVKIRIN